MNGGKKKNFQLKVLCMSVLLSFFMIWQVPLTAMAGGWLEDADKSIYERTYSDSQREAANDELEGLEDTYDGAAGDILSSIFAKFFVTVGDQIYKGVSAIGFDLNAIIYGRVGGSAYRTNDVSLFAYELSTGNIYGLVSMAIYNFLRSAVSVIMICVFLFQLVAFLYSSGNPKARDRIKSSSQIFIIMFLAMMVFPYLLDVALYIRDCILYGEMVFGNELIIGVGDSINPDWDTSGSGNVAFDFFGTGSSYSLIGTFRTIVENDLNVVNSAMYLGVVVIQLYFGISYISTAFSMLVLVILFPFCAILEMFQHTAISTWIKQVLGVLLNPILDSCLLLIPMLFMLMGYGSGSAGYYMVSLIACACILPARGVMRVFLGVGNGTGFELAGLGAVLGMMRLAGSVTRGIGNMASRVKDGVSSAKQDDDMADFYTDQARRQDLESVNEQQELQQDLESIFDKKEGRVDTGDITFNPITEDEMSEMTPEQRAMARQENLEQGMDALGIRKEQLNDEIRKGDMESNQLGTQMAEIDEHTAELRAKRAGYDPKDPAHQESIREIDQQIAENNIDKQKLVAEQKQLQMKNSEKKDQVGMIDTIERRAKTTQKNMRSGGGNAGGSGGLGSSRASAEQQRQLDQYATIDNFHLPEFKNISMEKKAQLYRDRARKTRITTAASVGTSAVGGVMLGATGFAGTTFASPSATAYATAIGFDIGTSAGGAVGDIVGARVAAINTPINTSQKHVTKVGGKEGESQVVKIPQVSQPAGYIEGAAPRDNFRYHLEGPNNDGPKGSQKHLPGYYSDWDRHGTPYERQPTDYEPNWTIIDSQEQIDQNHGEQERDNRQEVNVAYEKLFKDLADRSTLATDMKKSMREASAVARQSFNTIKENYGTPHSEAERRDYNQRIVDEAIEQYGRLMADAVAIGDVAASVDDFDYEEFSSYAEGRFKNTARSQMERYLLSKGILF